MLKSAKDKRQNNLHNNIEMQDLKIVITNAFAFGLSMSDANEILQACSLALAIIYTTISIIKKIKDNGKN